MSGHAATTAPRGRNREALDGPNKARPSVSRASIRRVLATIIWPRRWMLLLGLVLIGINKLAGLVLPWSSKVLIDDVIGQQNTSLLPLLLAGVGGAVLLQSASSFLQTRLLSVQAQHLISVLRARVQRHLIRLAGRLLRRQPDRGADLARDARRGGGAQPDRHRAGAPGGRRADRRGGDGHDAAHQRADDAVHAGADRAVRRAVGQGLPGDPPGLPRTRRHQRGGHRPADRVAERHPRDQGLPRGGARGRGLRARRAADLPERAQVADRHQHADQRWRADHGAVRGADHGRGRVADPARRHDRRRLRLVQPVPGRDDRPRGADDPHRHRDHGGVRGSGPHGGAAGQSAGGTRAGPHRGAAARARRHSSSTASPSPTARARRSCTASVCGRPPAA